MACNGTLALTGTEVAELLALAAGLLLAGLVVHVVVAAPAADARHRRPAKGA